MQKNNEFFYFNASTSAVMRFTRSVSEAPPTHYTVKIQSFSLLLKNSVEKYESGDFEAGGYKWKLVLYPAGNKSKNVKEHISVYLAMENTSSLQHGWEVYAVFRLFLLDQNKGNFLILQDAMGIERRFHRLKLEWGFDEFIPIKAFNDASNGFLLEDTCVFGAEVFVSKERSTGKGECLSMIKDAPSIKHVWRIDNFSKLRSECCDSQVFNSGDQKWKIQLYPTGRRHGTGTHLAMYLALADSTTLTPGSKIYAEFTVRLLDQVQARHIAGKANFWFSASNPESGWARYVSFAYFNNPGNGCLVKDVCSVEAEVTVHGVSNAL
ncbi:TRAF-like family protein [Citrus sinensis]|uniref:TRAF-like family protein n=1 Tax=Citrus sinensis TaxID=2711 RepID=A0ACB8IAQ9_CITSI|nr:TRAF-like family protein [Citrus sinensis]